MVIEGKLTRGEKYLMEMLFFVGEVQSFHSNNWVVWGCVIVGMIGELYIHWW